MVIQVNNNEDLRDNYEYEEPNIQKAHELWAMYEDGKAFQTSIDLTRTVPTCVDFVEGRQWPRPTKLTRNMPRPVFNMCAMIRDNKVSNVLGSPVKLNFILDTQEDTTKFTRFAEWQMKDMGMKQLDDRACNDGAVKGTYIYHFYWDDEAKGRRGQYEGAVRCQLIDVLNFIVSNPKEVDVQKQKWIMIVSRESVESVKAMASKGVDKTLIVPDDLESDYNEEEQENSKLCTLITRYFRKDGEVYWEKSVKGTIVTHETCLNPYVTLKAMEEQEKKGKKIDPEVDSQPTEKPQKDDLQDFDRYKAWFYPIACNSWIPRDRCIYGISEIEGIIPNQKAINFEFAMQILNHQELGWGKILVKPNALNGQTIDNTPGQIITDYTPGQNWGIQRLEGSALSGQASTLPAQIIEMTRAFTNSSEVLTGEMLSKDLSGTAIAQLQAQSQKPIARLQKNFWKTKEDIGKILIQFYKLYYEEVDYTYELMPDEQLKMEQKEGREVYATQLDVFDGRKYVNKEIAIAVEAGAGTQYSEIMAMDTLNNLFLNGAIRNMTTEQLEQYVTLMPDSALPFKAQLRAIIRKQQMSELGQIKAAYEQQTAEMEQLTNYVKQQEDLNKQLQQEIANLQNLLQNKQNEYDRELSYKQKQIENQNKFIFDSMSKEKEEKPQNEKPKKVVETGSTGA